MGNDFFLGWKLWQQMTFVLACGIVATVIVGLCKLQFDNYKIRKYSQVEKGKKAMTPEMLEAQPVEPLAEQNTKDDIPFGIRAIESGIEVDGVWISRSNTPVGSSASSITETRLPRSLNNSQLELPQAVYGSSRGSSRAPSTFDLAVNAERLPTNDSRSSSPGRTNSLDPRARPTVSTNLPYSNSSTTRNSVVLHALEGLEAGPSSTRYAPVKTPSNGSRSSDETDYMALQEGHPYEPAYINPRNTSLAPALVAVDPRWDLDLLQSHRLSHVAETGQLTPRVRRRGTSEDWASPIENPRLPQDVSTSNGIDYFAPRQKTPSPPLVASPISTEDMSIPSASKHNQAGQGSQKNQQAMPLLETYAPDAQAMHHSGAYPRGPRYEDQYEDQFAPQSVATSQNQRESQILRKVNSGFEILRPGTLGQPPSPEEATAADIANNNGDKRQSKRLQKRRKSSTGSRPSHFVEQV